MNPKIEVQTDSDEMQPEYNFSEGVRGKYFAAYQESKNIVVLDADVATVFSDSVSVNEALRMLLKITSYIQAVQIKQGKSVAPSEVQT